MSEGNMEFRSVPADPNKRGLKRKLSMIQSFASALASRNINNKKINKPIKQLRVLSCFGDTGNDGILPPCEHLMERITVVLAGVVIENKHGWFKRQKNIVN